MQTTFSPVLRRACFPGLILILGLLLSACGDDKKNDGCSSDSDCRNDRVCQAGACVAPDDENNTNNAGVENNSVAPENNNAPSCAEDSACDLGEVCDGGECRERTCTSDPDCGNEGRFCYAGFCYEVTACDSDAACDNGVCEDNRCVPACAVDIDCPDPASQTCVDAHCLDRCTGDSQCGAGEICGDNGACEPFECRGAGTEGCPDGERCDSGRCVGFTACDTDTDCSDDEACREGICEPRTRCVGDLQCANDEQCLDGFCREITTCDDRNDCPTGEDCVQNRCVPFVCRGAEDCSEGQICEAGDCVTPDPVIVADQVVILTPPRTVAPGENLQLQAVALDGNGDIIPGRSFAWFTNNAEAVDVNENTGLAVGQNVGGEAQITAQLLGSEAEVISAPLILRNPGAPVDDSVRVIVVDAVTGAPINDASVARGEAENTTSNGGVATFDTSNSDENIHVYAEGYNYTSLIQSGSSQVLVALTPRSGAGTSAGVTGQIDFTEISSSGDINIGLGSASLNQELSHFDLDALLGESFNTNVSVPGLFEQELPLPGGLILYGDVFGFSLDIKNRYYSRSAGGLKVAWSLGGQIDANEAFQLVGGGADASNIIATLLPFFENFDHGIRSVSLQETPLVADNGDLDGDGNTAELIPDYNSFPSVDITPNVRQRLRTGLQAPSLSNFNSDGTFVIVVGGVINQGIGFVPLGLNATQDDNNDGNPETVTLRMAPPHSGLSDGEYVVLALTFDPADLGADLNNGIDLPDNYSISFWRGRSIPTDLAMNKPFLPLPQGSWNGPGRSFSAQEVADADLFRVTFVGAEGSWEVWVDADAPTFNLPVPPAGFQDWSAGSTVRVEAFSTRDNLQLDEVSELNGSSLHHISEVSENFSRAIIE